MICRHCGCENEPEPPKKGKPRSVPQHRRYFAMVNAAHSHWPSAHRFKPATAEHLRHWLQAKSGYADINTIDTAGMTQAQSVAALAAAIIKAHPFHFVWATEAKFHVAQSKSISFDELPHLAACALFDAVADVIEQEMHVKVDQIMPPIRERKPGKVEQFAEVPL